MSTPVNASTTQSERRLGSNRTRPTETKTRAMIATRKRMATYEIGGKSRRQTLIASQVELQTMQSVSHAAAMRQSIRWIVSELPANIEQHSRRSAHSLRSPDINAHRYPIQTRCES